MQELVNVTGMILKSEPIGEYDRRVVILTKECGKISAFARGARKPGNRFMASTNPFCFGEFKLYPGKNAYTLQDIHIDNFFQELRDDFLGAYMGIYFMEIADYYGRENSDDTELLKLLYQSLRALIHPAYDNRLVRAVFEIKAIAVNGEFPGIFPDLNPESTCAYAISYIIQSPIEKLFRFSLTEEVLGELIKCAARYCTRCMDKKFKSLEILESIQ